MWFIWIWYLDSSHFDGWNIIFVYHLVLRYLFIINVREAFFVGGGFVRLSVFLKTVSLKNSDFWSFLLCLSEFHKQVVFWYFFRCFIFVKVQLPLKDVLPWLPITASRYVSVFKKPCKNNTFLILQERHSLSFDTMFLPLTEKVN